MIRRLSFLLAAGTAFASLSFAQYISSISPNSAPAGSGPVTVTINGQFPIGSALSVQWYVPAADSEAQLGIVSFSASQIVVTVPASLLTQPESAEIYVDNYSVSYATFTVTNQVPTLTSMSPNSAVAGGPAFTLTVNGANFPNTSKSAINVTWNGTALQTSYINSGQLTAIVPASLIASPGTASVTINSQPQPTPLTFVITQGPLILSAIFPSSATAGGPAVNLTASGSGFTPSTIVTWNGSPLSTTFTSSTSLNAVIPASLIATAGTASVDVTALGQTSPPPLTFTINPALTLTSLSPNSIAAGSSTFTLTLNGTGFTAQSTVNWNSSSLTATFLSSTQITATVPASLVAQTGSATIVVQSLTSVSNGLQFNITPAPLSLSSISPNTAVAGSPAFTLTANGSGFTNATSVTWNGSSLSTSFVSPTQLAAAVPANLIATAGAASVDVAASGQASPSPLNFTITSPAPTLTSLSPNTAIAGGAAFTLSATGSSFSSGSQLTWNGSPLSTTFVSTSQLTAAIPANLIATPGTVSVGVSVPGLTSPAPLPFTITPSLTLTSLTPSSAVAGSAAFTLTVNGSGFNSGTSILWNGQALSTSVLNANVMTASVPANLIAQQGSATITAQSGSLISNALTFSITSSQTTLTLTSLSPNSAPAGSPALTLTVNGSGFSPAGLAVGTTVTWNGSPLATTFLSATQLTASVRLRC